MVHPSWPGRADGVEGSDVASAGDNAGALDHAAIDTVAKAHIDVPGAAWCTNAGDAGAQDLATGECAP